LSSLSFMQVDPNIIGGLVVEIGDKYVDMSIKTRVNKMTQMLLDPI
jgi:F0F1-type ATP synthase delta subunit